MKKIQDKEMINHYFGEWRVLSRSENPKKWKCECSCGTLRDVDGASLRAGRSTNCGCKRKRKTLDITGQKFNFLTAIRPTNLRSGGHIVWECRCDCGNIHYVNVTHLKSGTIKSCGCLNKNNIMDIANKRFGKLIAIKPTEKRINRNVVWECKCDCGNIHYVTQRALVNGKSKSCGCLKTSYGENLIASILTMNNIIFKTEYKFLDPEIKKYRYDFAIFTEEEKLQYLIEFDGKQHYEYSNQGWNTKENFDLTQQRDSIKNNYCIKNNIPLIRIPYWEINNLTLSDLLLDTTKYRVV